VEARFPHWVWTALRELCPPHREKKPCEKKLYNAVKKKRGMTGAELAEKDSDGDFTPAEIQQAKPKLDMRMKMGVSCVVGNVAGFYKAS
jgi:hypothetical protein